MAVFVVFKRNGHVVPRSPPIEENTLQAIIRGRFVLGTVIDSVGCRGYNGVGIEPKYRDQIFHKFTRLDSGDTRQVSGTGLGLSIVQALVEAQGGTVDFVSQPGAVPSYSAHSCRCD